MKNIKDVSQFVMLGKNISEQPRRNCTLTMPEYKRHWYDKFVEPALFIGTVLCFGVAIFCFMYSFLMLSKFINGY